MVNLWWWSGRRSAPAAVLRVVSGAAVGFATLPSPAGRVSMPGSSGVVWQRLTDPAGAERALLAGLRSALIGWWASWAPAVIAVVVAGVTLRLGLAVWHARTWRRARDAAGWLAVVPPAATTTAQGQLLWRVLAGVLRPGRLGRHARLLAWEVHADAEQVVAGLWVPSSVGAGQVSEAAASCYLGARIVAGPRGRCSLPGGLTPAGSATAGLWRRAAGATARRCGCSPRPRGPVSVGYLLVPGRSMWAPLLGDTTLGSGQLSPRSRAGDETGDGLRMAFAALANTPVGYRTVLQVLARPLPPGTNRAARRVRRADGGPPGPGLPARALLGSLGLVEAVMRTGLDLLAPGPSTTRAPARSGREPSLDPVTASRRREALVKAGSELVEVCVRVVVSGPNRAGCRQEAFTIANALRQVVTAQPLEAVRLPAAGRTVAARGRGNWRAVAPLVNGARHRRGWFVATDTEVGALARLPHRPAVHRFETAGAPHLPAPADLPRIPLPPADPPDGGGEDTASALPDAGTAEAA